MRAAEDDLGRAVERVNQVFAQDVTRFRERVAALNVTFFPALEPLSLEARPSR